MQSWTAELQADLPPWLWELSVVGIACALGVALALIAHRVLFGALRRVARASRSEADDDLLRHIARPTRWALVALALVLGARETAALEETWQRIAGIVMPALVGWIALAILRAMVQAMERQSDISVADNLLARRRRTRLAIFSRMASFMIIFLTVGLMLLSIPGVRDVGVTLMASAGLAGLAVGAAAQPALKSLIGGLQLALTEPIRIDDVVVIDGEWGRIEDIRTTYVVVKLWDERRLIVPTSRFLDDTFQNWTRRGAEIMGSVFLYLDPFADLGPIRAEFERFTRAHDLWDGRSLGMQVTETKPDHMEVRLLVSAANASKAFDLRCAIREHMLAWLRDTMPEAIVRQRVQPATGLDAEQAAAAALDVGG